MAYQRNKEADWIERPIRRLTRVRYSGVCTDMQLEIIKEFQSGIEHAVRVNSAFFWEAIHGVYHFKRCRVAYFVVTFKGNLTLSSLWMELHIG